MIAYKFCFVLPLKTLILIINTIDIQNIKTKINHTISFNFAIFESTKIIILRIRPK